MRSLGLTLALLACLGCGEESAHEPATLELGTGSWRFDPLTDGQQVELVRGAQGGWHIWLSLRTQGVVLGDEPVLVDLRMQPADGSLPSQKTAITLVFDAKEDDRYELVGYTGIVSEPSCWVEKLVRVQVSLPSQGLEDEREVIVSGGAYPPPPCP